MHERPTRPRKGRGTWAYFSMPCQASSVKRSRFSRDSSASVSAEEGRLLGLPLLCRLAAMASYESGTLLYLLACRMTTDPLHLIAAHAQAWP